MISLAYLTRYVVPGMVERNFGHVINIGSIVEEKRQLKPFLKA